jgi:cytoskeletal protein CcmA (bactofilin family)
MYDCTRIAVPQHEHEIAEYDWENFPPSRYGGRHGFTIIDEATGIEGKLVARHAYIHGQIEGLLFAEHVVIEKTGRVKGVIFCRTLTVFGAVHANIICDNIHVRAGGTLTAVLKYRNMMVEPGGSVGGKFERRTVIDALPARKDASA